jgi:hypothetical protein
MTDQIGHVKVLTNVIEKLVDERRALAVSMMLGHKRRRTDDTQTNDMRNHQWRSRSIRGLDLTSRS